MQNALTKTLKISLDILLVAGLLFALSSAASAEALDLEVGFYDLTGAHNERIVVTFGKEIEFKKYCVVKVLNQYSTVAAAVPGGVRYNTLNTKGEQQLIIN